MEGTVTGEHGIGLKLKGELIEEIGENAVNTMRSVGCLESLGSSCANDD